MGILRKIEGLVKKIDFFYSKEMLRYDEEEDYKTFTGGLISIGIIVAIIVGFASMIMNTLNQTSISTSTQVIKNQIPPNSTLEITPESDFRFAIQIWRVNLSDTKRYFDVILSTTQQSNGVIEQYRQVPLEACSKQYFARYPDIAKSFDKLQAGEWLCPPMNTTMNLYGKYSADEASLYTITVGACHNETDPSRPCASPAQIEDFFNLYQDAFYFDFYYINPQINSDQKDYKKFYLEDMSYVIFGRTLGSENFLFFTDYTINTDYSIWPYQNIIEDKGCIVEDLPVSHHFQTNINSTYVVFNLAKSANSLIYTREVQKVSAVISFMGGMIGAISAVLFIIKIYTNVAFEFSISSELFKHSPEVNQGKGADQNATSGTPEKKEEELEHISINFFTFLKYYCYRFMKMIGKSCDWPVMRYADKCKQQITKQLDIKVLLKRVIFLQHSLTYLIEDYHLNALQMKRPLSPEDIRLIRQKCQRIEDQDNPSNSDSASQYTDKQNPKDAIETPNNCITINSPMAIKSRFAPNNRVAPDIVVLNIEDSVSGNIGRPSIGNGGTGNILNFEKRLKFRNSRRSSYLQDLHRSALEGNTLSFKLWSQLDDKVKKETQQAEELEEQSEKEHFQ